MLLLRTYRIPRPVTVKVREEYLGCHSWLELQRELPFEGTPVLSDDEFERASEEIETITREVGVSAACPGVAALSGRWASEARSQGAWRA